MEPIVTRSPVSTLARRALPLLRTSLAILACAVVGVHAIGAPEPSPTPTRWQLDIQPGPLRVGMVDVRDVGPRAFFFMPYKVVNNSGEDLYFAPSFELALEDGTLFRSGRGVPLEVTEALIARLENPFLEDQISMIGVLRQGEENAREGVVVWPAQNLKTSEITVYATGFSGETRRVVKPHSAADGGEPEEVVLRKTLMLVHATPGQLTHRGNRPLERTIERWIMR